MQEGVIKSISATGLVMEGNAFGVSVPFDQIAKVEKSSYRIRKGTLIGLALGAGAGLLMVGEADSPIPFILGTGIGLGAGITIGAVLHATRGDRDVIYDARRRTTTIALSPILSPTRKGLAFSMTWR